MDLRVIEIQCKFNIKDKIARGCHVEDKALITRHRLTSGQLDAPMGFSGGSEQQLTM